MVSIFAICFALVTYSAVAQTDIDFKKQIESLGVSPLSEYKEPSWFNYLNATFQGINLKRCPLRQTAPSDGEICGLAPKTCFFGDQQCIEIGAYPSIECFCSGGSSSRTWKCKPALCPSKSSTPTTPKPSLRPQLPATRIPTPRATLLPTMQPSTQSFECPLVGGVIDMNIRGGEVRLKNSNVDVICLLVEIKKEGFLKPVGRSYGSFDWEQSPGENSKLSFNCVNGLCTTTLPLIEEGSRYQISAFNQPLYSMEDEAARFLEQATFGQKMTEVQQLASGDLSTNIASWIQNQQNDVPMTSHREFYRKRLNARHEAPQAFGAVTHPCEVGTRFRRFAFSSKDDAYSVQITTLNDKKVLRVNNAIRTVVEGSMNSADSMKTPVPDGTYGVCSPAPQNKLWGYLRLQLPRFGCTDVTFNGQGGNPPINFDAEFPEVILTFGSDEVVPVDTQFYQGEVPIQELIVKSPLSDPQCLSIPELKYLSKPVFARFEDNFWIHDPRFDLLNNEVNSPIPDGGASVVKATKNTRVDYSAICSNVRRSFLNGDGCVMSSSPDVCSPEYKQDDESRHFDVVLDHKLLRAIYNTTGNGKGSSTRYFYAIDQLRIKDDVKVAPTCAASTRSRWVRTSPVTCTNSNITSATSSVLSTLLSQYEEINKNPNILDVFFPQNGIQCSPEDTSKVGFAVFDQNGDCWTNVHPDHLSVYDFTPWTISHPGNSPFRNPIKEFAEAGNTTLLYPLWKNMERWQTNKGRFPMFRRLGDTMNYYDIPQDIRSATLDKFVGIKTTTLNDVKIVGNIVCGSPNEIANDLSLGGSEGKGAFDAKTPKLKTTETRDFEVQKRNIWVNIALNAQDQLRQRIAWALSQILVVSTNAIEEGTELTEIFTAYFDIFVRNAFGNYRNVLKEVSFSPLMGEMLTYIGSRSTAHVWETQGNLEYADENYAREIMQLFSIGLFKLNSNGTPIKDTKGVPIQVYSNEDIMEYARAWTGFVNQANRGNIESMISNRIDPMQINPRYRDRFPKMGLDRKYIGDGFPICNDLPKKHFLSKGATYQLLGKNPVPELHSDPVAWARDPQAKFLTLTPSGENSLFSKLCGSDNPDACQYPSKVVLDTSIPCNDAECNIDTIRTVKVSDGVFYEYIRPACVHQAFFNDAKLIGNRLGLNTAICANPRIEAASSACCDQSTEIFSWKDEYWGERTTFETAQQRCSQQLCTLGVRPTCDTGIDPSLGSSCVINSNYWIDAPCMIRAKFDSKGNAAVVHSPVGILDGDVAKIVQKDTKTVFRVDWNVDVTSFLLNCTSIPYCEVNIENLCVCDVTVQEEAVYSDISTPTSDEVIKMLRVGAFDPKMFQQEYTSKQGNGITWYMLNGKVDSDTILEVTDVFGIRHFRKNLESTVYIKGTSVSFRNPVHFMSLSNAEARDAYYETDAALDHYLYHPNTAPFLAIRFAQRFGNSNPSPRYIESITSAFRKGSYTYYGPSSTTVFGTGNYGDLAATFACVLLDREARNPFLDVDPSFGSIREPFLKIIGLMRSLDFMLFEDKGLVDFRTTLGSIIGQAAHEIRDVFSFFPPEYQPPGVVTSSSLVSPESIVMNGPKVLGLLNGFMSLIKYGLDSCYEGFGHQGFRVSTFCSSFRPGNYQFSDGKLTFTPSQNNIQTVVSELATIMTAGRLSETNRAIVQSVLVAEKNVTLGLIKAQQLIATTAEFHTTNVVRNNGQLRLRPPPRPESTKPYKAVIYILLSGGYDSYNMLAPHKCEATNADSMTLLEQYYAIRNSIAINDTERSRTIDAVGQPCSQFVVHEELAIVEKLYKEGELSFFANTGVINRPVNKNNYAQVTKTELFAHNTMQREAQRIDPFNGAPGTGVFGRMGDILKSKGFIVQPVTVEDSSVVTVGVPGKGVPPLTVSSSGTPQFIPKPSRETFNAIPYLNQMNGNTELYSGLFGEVWSSSLHQALINNQMISESLNATTLTQTFSNTDYSKKMSVISKLIASHKTRGTDREIFFANLPGWDTHRQVKKELTKNFNNLNSAFSSFYNEMKTRDLWKNVTLVVVSDFARTLSPNSGDGSDHAWGGNYFLMGGEVKGGMIHGEYPGDITESGPVNIGRGRLIPTTSWESLFNGVTEWMGMETEEERDFCLPNRKQTGSKLYSRADLYKQ